MRRGRRAFASFAAVWWDPSPRTPSGLMRIAAALRVLDEVDLIEGSLQHLRALGVDVIVVIDEGSTDGTLDRLAAIEPGAWLHLAHAGADTDTDTERLERDLLDALQPDWELRLAAGDRLLSATGSLRDPARLDGIDALTIERFPAALTTDGLDPTGWTDQVAIAGIAVHRARLLPPRPRTPGKDLPRVQSLRPAPLRLVRTAAMRGASSGVSSGAAGPDQPTALEVRGRIAADVVAIAAPLTRPDRFARHVAGARARPATWLDGIRDPGPAWIVERWTALEGAALAEAFLAQQLDPTDLETLERYGVVQPARVFIDPDGPPVRAMPELGTNPPSAEALASLEPWSAGFRVAASELGLDPSLPVRCLPSTYPTAMIGEAVIRLYGPWLHGATAMAQEATVLRLLEQDPAIPAPRILGTGWLDRAWAWLAMSVIPGRPLLDVRDTLDPDGLDAFSAWLGDVIRRIHRIPVERAVRRAALPDVVREIRRLHATVTERQRGHGTLHPRLVDRLADWMPPLDALLPGEDDLVLAHLDLHDANVLGTVEHGRFVATGVIDFGNAGLGHPLHELGALCGQTLRGDPRAMARFLERARPRFPDGLDRGRVALAWILLDDHDQLEQVPGIGAFETPDELAAHLFGGRPPASGPGPMDASATPSNRSAAEPRWTPARVPATAVARAGWLTRARSRLAARRHRRIVVASGLFDPTWYIEHNPDVRARGIDPLAHYLSHGGPEGRDPGPDLDARDYRQRYPDVKAASADALLHYLLHGRAEGRTIRPVGHDEGDPLAPAPSAGSVDAY